MRILPLMALLAALVPAAGIGAPANDTCAMAKTDFLVRSDPTLTPPRPAHCSSTTQTPPEFVWPPQKGENTYTLVLTHPDGRSETRRTTNNWLLWDRELAPGAYTWRLEVSGAVRDASQPRRFTIAPGAVPFVVPAADKLLAQVRAVARPRTWSADPTRPLAAVRSKRAAAWTDLVQEVENKMPAQVQPEPVATSIGANYEDTVAEQKRTLGAALAWAVTRDPRFARDARRRLLAQAGWSVTGPISYANNDMANRTVAWTLALSYDWMHDGLSAEDRATILAAIKARTEPMYADVVPRLAAYPYDSHGNVTLTIVAAIAALTAGDLPEADKWLREALPVAVIWTSPWGHQDGGFANGTAQMFWDTGSNLPAWYVLRNAAGVDMARKEWVRNHARFMAYFAPPGAPAGVFGDGQELELNELAARVSKALARFVQDPFSRWYARSLAGEDASRIELMLSPVVDLGASSALPGDAPNGAVFPSVGWVAMHSRLEDRKRTSVYFKSSPYGSYNHAHADQNSFVIDHRGVRLAWATGYYDGYKTPHWNDWYKQTRAANAITFDGGQGQGVNGKEFAGEIVRFESRPQYDYAIGRAERAYGGALTEARRTIVYLRPGIVLVHDRLASATPRTWEWNIHAARRMEPRGDRAIRIRDGEAQMCVEVLSGPDTRFTQNDRFDAPPQGKGMPSQWHGRFGTVEKSKSAEFLVLMRVGTDCRRGTGEGRASAAVARAGTAWRVQLEGASVLVGGDDVQVEAAPMTAAVAAPTRGSPPGT
ncbi:MAG TPA: DUF4962 domain-containing protein [Usitatibacter sp.]|nr:DUF4962 domain-containing protein [Usitatibacter sp.]